MSFFTIELLSDLCYSNGEGFGSVIDTDIAFDKYGIPVIKGKSLKGCLRDCAVELSYIDDSIETEQLFGKAGDDKSGALKIYDAHPVNYNEILKDLDGKEYNTEQILSCYTYVRTQTAIGPDGTAKPESLRSTRVLKKGLTFLCEYECDDKYAGLFENCLAVLRRIGLHRNRGLGEIKCSKIEDSRVEYHSVVETKNGVEKDKNEIKDGKCYLTYKIETCSALIPSKEYQDFRYINASSMLGYVFEKFGTEEADKMLGNGLKITNAYISDGIEPYFPNPAFLAKQKTASFDDEKKMPLFVFDTKECNEANPPALAWKGNNVSIDRSKTISLDTEINYHHKLDDENPGQISGKNFYQLESVSAGQIFMGKIYGKQEDLERIYNELSKDSNVSFGYFRSTGYGQCRLTLTKSESKEQKINTDKIAVWLHSPAIIYDENLMPCAKPDVFKEYISEKFSVKNELFRYLRFTEIGGYNVSWQMHKQTTQVYDGGTVFVYELNEPIEIESNGFIGERTFEGFGEYSVIDYNTIEGSFEISKAKSECASEYPEYKFKDTNEDINRWKLPSEIIDRKQHDEEIVTLAISNYKKLPEINSTQVGRLLLMIDESKKYMGLKKSVDSIKREKQKEVSQKWIKLPDGVNENEYKRYLTALLTQKKYELRGKDE